MEKVLVPPISKHLGVTQILLKELCRIRFKTRDKETYQMTFGQTIGVFYQGKCSFYYFIEFIFRKYLQYCKLLYYDAAGTRKVFRIDGYLLSGAGL